ncbi:MAG TPA: HAD hydrolase-like protein [Candidatus Nanoarchaeia archaeon]|nr:HAD hydrolase-like protein [Candidatus Nanoarchaeia archaeon]
MAFKKCCFYDFDGVLGDSLSAHIIFLHDMNKLFDMGLNLPNPNDYEACKKTTKSSMHEFIREAGFQEKVVKEIDNIYKEEFHKNERYKFSLFPDIKETLSTLFQKGFLQGIISANYTKNIKHPLLNNGVERFLTFVYGREDLINCNKGETLKYLKTAPFFSSDNKFILIGDTEGDYSAAVEAEVEFVGVAYGWGFDENEKRFSVAKDPKHLQEILLGLK